MTTEAVTHNVVVTQRYAEKEIRDQVGASIRVGVTTTQVVDETGIDRQLHLEVTQPDDAGGRGRTITVRKNLSWQDAKQIYSAAEVLAERAERWHSIPSASRNSIEFTTTVGDGIVIGRRTRGDVTEYFISASDDGHTARCVLGPVTVLADFVTHMSEAANLLR